MKTAAFTTPITRLVKTEAEAAVNQEVKYERKAQEDDFRSDYSSDDGRFSDDLPPPKFFKKNLLRSESRRLSRRLSNNCSSDHNVDK